MTYTVTITRPGYGRYSGGSYITSKTFVDEKKARDYYTDCLVRYPKYNVELLKGDSMKVIKTTDGKFAIVARTQVWRNLAIWSPIDERRWDNELSAQNALMRIRWGIPEPKPAPAPKPKATIDRSHLPLRDSLRITKLDKKAFVVELKKNYGWEKLKTFKTKTKAEEWCATNSR